jgi:spermidine/putrescine transport system permease protein
MKLVNLLLGSWTLLVLLFLYLPIVLLVIYSFNDSKLNLAWKGFTFRWYTQLWSNRPLIEAAYNSLIIAAVTTVVATVLGTAGAWLLYRYHYPLSRLINTLVAVPMIIPEIIMGISLLIFFTAVNIDLGYTTVIISHVTFCFPFVMIAVQARLVGVDPSLEEAAMDLGATPAQAFFKVMLPYLLPAIISGALMSFTLSLDELIVTYFTYSPDSVTLPIKVFGMAKIGLSPMLNAISTLFIAATVVLVVIAETLRKI